MNKKTLLFFGVLLISLYSKATTITVTNTGDSGSGSLREALTNANNGDTINFSVTGVITVSSQLDISKDVVIQGPGAHLLAIDGGGVVTVFRDQNYSINNVVISGLEIRNGFSGAYGAGIGGLGYNLTVKYCNIHSNTLSAGYGAAISVWSIGSSLTIENSTIHNNTVSGYAACIYVQEGGNLSITNSTIYNNHGSFAGQAIFAEGSDITLTNVTLAGHSTGWNAIDIKDYEDFIDTSNNKAASITMVNCIFDNAISNYSFSSMMGGVENSLGYNISNDNSMAGVLNSTGDLNNTSSLLDTSGLQNHGGTTLTVGLNCGSPAIDAGTLLLTYDQIDSARHGSGPDIGAYESNNLPSTGTDTRTECDSYLWIDGNTYTSSNNTATYNLINGASNGCDSIVTLDLTILNSASGTDTRTECNSYTWIDGNTYTSSNNSATYNLINGASNGCDSIVTLDLTIITIDTTTSTSSNVISATMAGASYQWMNCDSNYALLTGEINQSFTPLSNGNYAVEITLNGCVDTSYCINFMTVDIAENSFNHFSAYPNPSKSQIHLKTDVSLWGSFYSVYNNTGQLILKGKISSETTLVELTGFSEGLYLFSIGDNLKQSFQVIKE